MLQQLQADHAAGKLQLGVSRPASIWGCWRVLGGVAACCCCRAWMMVMQQAFYGIADRALDEQRGWVTVL